MITEERVMTLLAECNPVPDVTTLDLSADLPTTRLAESSTRIKEMTELESEHSATRPASGRHRLILGAAAMAIVMAALILLRATGTAPIATPDDSTVTDQATDSPVEVATAFVKAFGAFDIDTATSYLAPDANLAGFGDDWALNRKFLDFIGFKLILDSCDLEAASEYSTTVRCDYDYHALRSEEMSLGPFGGSYLDLIIRDGEITSVNQQFDYMASGFSSQMWEPFAAWVAENYPEDAAVMYADWPNQSMQALTDESLSLWEQRSWDYATRVTLEEIVDPEEILLPASDTRPTYRGSVQAVEFSFEMPFAGWEHNIRDLLIAKSIRGPQGAEAILFWTSFPDATYADPCASISDSPTSASGLATAVANLAGIKLLSGPTDVTVGGFPAKKVTFIVREDVGCDPGFFYTWKAADGGAIWDRSGQSDAIKVWIVDVDGTLLVIVGETKADAGPRVLAEIEYIVQSIRFE